LDIMNPHYAPYYEDKSKPPADYYSPRPIFFIAVAHGSKFRFSIAPRTSDVTINDVCEGLNLLQQALENLGAGAKTAVGYGYFK
jgi:CRISPR-associated protein Cmr6